MRHDFNSSCGKKATGGAAIKCVTISTHLVTRRHNRWCCYKVFHAFNSSCGKKATDGAAIKCVTISTYLVTRRQQVVPL